MGLPVPVKMLLRYARHNLVGADMLASTLTGGLPGETISYRAAKGNVDGRRFGCALCRFLDLFQKDHCAITLRNHDTQRTVGS